MYYSTDHAKKWFLLLIAASTAMAAAYMTIAQTMVTSHPMLIVADSSTPRAILFAVSLTTVAVHFPFPPYLY
jgi:hypothetical protein